jgi:uncharacterized membrane protein
MLSNKLASGRFVPELVAAGVVLILGAVGAARLAVAPPNDIPISHQAWSALMVALAVVLAAAGIECIRRRHFLFVILVPLAPALVTLVYVIETGQIADLNSLWALAVVMAMVASRRSAFGS